MLQIDQDLKEETRPSRAVDLSRYRNRLTIGNKIGRALWSIIWLLLFRPSPRICHGWRRLLLRLFGAKIAVGVRVNSSCRIWAPWNLAMSKNSWMGDQVECYSVDRICIEDNAIVSQFAFLCSAGHDISDPLLPLITAPITVGPGAWICAGAYVGMGVSIGAGAVVAARAVVVKNVEPWTVVGGNPAKFLKVRELKGKSQC